MPTKRPIFLFAFANDAAGSLRLGEEQNACWNELAALDINGTIKCERLGFATLEQVFKEFNRYNNQIYIFHYGGHSNSEILLLPDAPVRAQHLGVIIGQQKNLKLVFLNGCKNYDQVKAFFDCGIPIVIATTAKVDDGRATDLARQFYQALATGSSIGNSFESAKAFSISKYPELKSTFRTAGFSEDTNESDFSWGLYFQKKSDLDWSIPPTSGKQPIAAYWPLLVLLLFPAYLLYTIIAHKPPIKVLLSLKQQGPYIGTFLPDKTVQIKFSIANWGNEEILIDSILYQNHGFTVHKNLAYTLEKDSIHLYEADWKMDKDTGMKECVLQLRGSYNHSDTVVTIEFRAHVFKNTPFTPPIKRDDSIPAPPVPVPVITAEPKDLGVLRINESKKFQLLVRNSGKREAQNLNLENSCDYVELDPIPSILASNGFFTLAGRFKGRAHIGAYNCPITIRGSNFEPISFNVKARVQQKDTCEIYFDTNGRNGEVSVIFDNGKIFNGESKRAQWVTIKIDCSLLGDIATLQFMQPDKSIRKKSNVRVFDKEHYEFNMLHD